MSVHDSSADPAPLAPPYIHPSAVVAKSAVLGPGVKVWHFCHVMDEASLGEGTLLGQGCFVAARVRIGRNVRLQNNVSVVEGVELEDDVFCGPSAVFTNVKNPRAAVSRRAEFGTIRVGQGATLGANCTIVTGVTIGRYAFVAAGAVVTKDVPAFGLVQGVPARAAGWMSRAGERLRFDEQGRARCPRRGDEYRLTTTGVEVVEGQR